MICWMCVVVGANMSQSVITVEYVEIDGNMLTLQLLAANTPFRLAESLF